MSDRKAVHLEVLPPEQIRVLRVLAPVVRRARFYLAGGTALALQLGHRRSVDFDWFAPRRVPAQRMVSGPIRAARLAMTIGQASDSTLVGRAGTVRFSFFTYRYPLLRPARVLTGLDCAVASLDDLAAMKIAAVADRSTRRDFVDIVALLRSGYTLGRMLDLYRRKYALTDIGQALLGLVYFRDADEEPMPDMIADWDWSEIKAEIRARVREFAR